MSLDLLDFIPRQINSGGAIASPIPASRGPLIASGFVHSPSSASPSQIAISGSTDVEGARVFRTPSEPRKLRLSNDRLLWPASESRDTPNEDLSREDEIGSIADLPKALCESPEVASIHTEVRQNHVSAFQGVEVFSDPVEPSATASRQIHGTIERDEATSVDKEPYGSCSEGEVECQRERARLEALLAARHSHILHAESEAEMARQLDHARLQRLREEARQEVARTTMLNSLLSRARNDAEAALAARTVAQRRVDEADSLKRENMEQRRVLSAILEQCDTFNRACSADRRTAELHDVSEERRRGAQQLLELRAELRNARAAQDLQLTRSERLHERQRALESKLLQRKESAGVNTAVA
eukprot:TRINITY_DN32971_c0_g1_i1.p1 TRINITY_DN32971_c0_g1~~TRINITY_DN32971_c0_g1_i1.p1  ORF type:complete len:358 (+),score=38.83 TRINITY_DN32971_c0_g1_i1:60-1133(+)